jgi:hypothetical protein
MLEELPYELTELLMKLMKEFPAKVVELQLRVIKELPTKVVELQVIVKNLPPTMFEDSSQGEPLNPKRHNINNYVDKIKHETGIVIDPSKILEQESCTKNAHFFSFDLEKRVFHKNLGIFFLNIQMHMLGIPCLLTIPHIKVFSMNHIMLFLLRHLIVLLEITIIICWALFYLTWKLLSLQELVSPHL